MKIVIDSNIPFIKGVLEPYAKIEYAEGSTIDSNILADADAMVIRSRTICNRELLDDTAVKFIGTATIGTDHIDLDWCRSSGIEVASAPGCNAASVMQYIASSLAYLVMKYKIDPPKTTVGLIGIGNVGSRVAKMTEAFGFRTLLNDPPRQRDEGDRGFSAINEITDKSDILSIHVPLTYEGRDKTFRMVDEKFLSALKEGAIVINTSRGEVIEENALLDYLKLNRVKAALLDVWNKEPHINRQLLNMTDISTPHIAGYSLDGKARGTAMIVNRLAEHFKLPLARWEPEPLPSPDNPVIDISAFKGDDHSIISRAILHTYNVEDDSAMLKKEPWMFEQLRNNYHHRREFGAYKIQGHRNELIKRLQKMGFK
ncbi:MAG: 4-phosphoerythronate dehydrogenase [Bacteroidales bacterium]|nr:4-phosphoerythronate dehydrogenase [Bacteroidales bacterium]